MKKLRIAQVAPLWKSVPPTAYGGIESIVSLLAEELTQRGHQVTLFAAGDSKTSATLVPCCPASLMDVFNRDRSDNWTKFRRADALELHALKRVFDRHRDFDMIHLHVEAKGLSFADQVPTPTVLTHHMNPIAEIDQFQAQYPRVHHISVSDAQQQLSPELNFVRTVYNATEIDRFPVMEPQGEPYLAFLGRMSPQKGADLAIQVAQKTGLPLKMAGNVDFHETAFFAKQIKPYIDGQQIQYLGQADHTMKVDLLGNAIAMLFPITWEEPFGLVMIESMACGTPVVALDRGSVREVIAHGETGFICRDVDEMVDAIAHLSTLDRQACRDRVQKCFTVQSMVDGYETAYQSIMGHSQ